MKYCSEKWLRGYFGDRVILLWIISNLFWPRNSGCFVCSFKPPTSGLPDWSLRGKEIWEGLHGRDWASEQGKWIHFHRQIEINRTYFSHEPPAPLASQYCSTLLPLLCWFMAVLVTLSYWGSILEACHPLGWALVRTSSGLMSASDFLGGGRTVICTNTQVRFDFSDKIHNMIWI